jgi:hypothetical protein
MTVHQTAKEAEELTGEFAAKRRAIREGGAAIAAAAADMDRATGVRAGAADRRQAYDDAAAEFREYGESFRADVAAAGDDAQALREVFAAFVREFAADLADRRGDHEAARDAVRAYADAFASDAAARREAIDAFRADVADRARSTTEYGEAFRADVAAAGDDVADRASSFAAARAAVADYVREFHGDETPRRSAADAAAGDRSVEVDADSDAEVDAATDAEVDAATDAEVGADSTTEPTGADVDGGDGIGSDPDPGTESAVDAADADDESPDDAAAGSDELAGVEARLADIPYTTLKRAANQLSYPDDLNRATKEDLVGFIAEQGPDEIERALGADGDR